MLSSLLNNKHKEFGKRKSQQQQNIVKLYGIVLGKFSLVLQYEAMIDTKYEDMAQNYKIVWLMNELKCLCAGVDSHIDKIYSAFHTLKDFYMIRQQSGEMVTKYFNSFKLARVNEELSKGNLIKHGEL